MILADSQAYFPRRTAKVLTLNEDFRIIAQCADVERMMHAITTHPERLFSLRLRCVRTWDGC